MTWEEAQQSLRLLEEAQHLLRLFPSGFLLRKKDFRV